MTDAYVKRPIYFILPCENAGDYMVRLLRAGRNVTVIGKRWPWFRVVHRVAKPL